MEQRNELAPRVRLLLAAVGLTATALLLAAGRLTPDRRGFGTHEQLGMAPCWFMRWSGRPCPTCGMTTAWALAVRGRVGEAVAANAGGAVTCVLAIIAAPLALATSLAGKRFGRLPLLHAILWVAAVAMAVTLLDWGQRIAAG